LLVGRLEQLGWTRIGSPVIFEAAAYWHVYSAFVLQGQALKGRLASIHRWAEGRGWAREREDALLNWEDTTC